MPTLERYLSWMPMRRGAALAALFATACATTGATLGSGVGDATLEHPPYYAGAPASSGAVIARVGHLPVAYQRGATQPAGFDPGGAAATPVGRLLTDMNRFLDSLGAATGVSVRVVDTLPPPGAALTPPDVRFGCITASGLPDDDCAERESRALGRGRQAMRLAVGRPSSEWTTWMARAARRADVAHVLVLTLEVGQYLPRQVRWLGSKEVELGTSHVAKLPWLTSLETPVTVLQLTGTLVGEDGRSARIGAEGIVARRTRLAVSAVGGQELLTDDDIEAARSARRDDLTGRPLAWEVALRHLVAQLTGRGDLAPHVATSQ